MKLVFIPTTVSIFNRTQVHHNIRVCPLLHIVLCWHPYPNQDLLIISNQETTPVTVLISILNPISVSTDTSIKYLKTKLYYRLMRYYFTRDIYPGFITRVLFPEVCDTRVFWVKNSKNLTDNEQSPISTHTTYTPHINT